MINCQTCGKFLTKARAKENMKTCSKVKGGSSSWDRWYKKYQEQKSRVSYNGNTSAFQADAVGSIPSTRSKNDIKAEVLSIYKCKGYYSAVEYVNGLYSKDDITLMTKSSINNDLTFIQSHNKKQQRMLLNEVS